MKTKLDHQSGIGILSFLLSLASLPLWNNFSPYIADSIIEYESDVAFNCETISVRTTTHCSITRTPEEIVAFDPNLEIMYLGSLIQGKGYVKKCLMSPWAFPKDPAICLAMSLPRNSLTNR